MAASAAERRASRLEGLIPRTHCVPRARRRVYPGRDAGPQRRGRQQREEGLVACERVGVVGIARLDQALDPTRRSSEYPCHFVGLGRRQWKKVRGMRPAHRVGIDAVECEGVEVDVQV